MTTPYPDNADWPAHFQACTYRGKFVNLDGSIPSGYLELTPAPSMLLVVDDNITVVPVVLLSPQLDEHGVLADWLIPATDDPNVVPARWTYHVKEVWTGGLEYDLPAPVGTVVDLTVAVPVPSSVGVPRYFGPKGDIGVTGPPGPAGTPGTAGFGVATLDSTGIAARKVPTAVDGTHVNYQFPLGADLTGTPAAGKVPTATSPTAADWEFPLGAALSGSPAAGKVPVASSGSAVGWQYPLGVPVSGTPDVGDVLSGTGSAAAWAPPTSAMRTQVTYGADVVGSGVFGGPFFTVIGGSAVMPTVGVDVPGGTNYSTATGQWTCPATGGWECDGVVEVASTTGVNTASVWLYKNGAILMPFTQVVAPPGAGVPGVWMLNNREFALAAGDLLTVRVRTTASSGPPAYTVYSGSGDSFIRYKRAS